MISKFKISKIFNKLRNTPGKPKLKFTEPTDPDSLLIEIGTEELPALQIADLEASLKTNFAQELTANNIEFAQIESFSTPRRLALRVTALAAKQPDSEVERQGPNVNAAFDANGNPTKAGLGFAKACNTTIDKLNRKHIVGNQAGDETIVLTANVKIPGKCCKDLVPTMLQHALTKLPIKRKMHWGELDDGFVRPIRWLLILFGKDVIQATIFGIHADRHTYGHRFLHPQQITIQDNTDIANYAEILSNTGKVIANSAIRAQTIRAAVEAAATACGGKAKIDNDLLAQVTGLVEYPVVLTASFAKEFLLLPKEALISAMQEYQRCFPVFADNTGDTLLPKFILVSNIVSTHPATVISGNEKVMHARLADAEFHYKYDLQQTLASRLDKLSTVIFQQQLGTMHDKAMRIKVLAVYIAKQISAVTDTGINAKQLQHIARAAELCKADLLTNMVGEFPELQGIMGGYYARNDGEAEEVAKAIREHYLPKHATDSLPKDLPGICLALADRLDSVVGLFAIGKAPTADKDPFALRRQTLAILRLLIEKSLPLDLAVLFATALDNYSYSKDQLIIINQLLDFSFDRLRGYCLDRDASAKTFTAVLAKRSTNPCDFFSRLQAVQNFQLLPEAASLSNANKRVSNILAKANNNATAASSLNETLITQPAERELFEALLAKEHEIKPLLQQSDFTNTLKALAELNTPIANFFDNVMVLTDDAELQNNRLALLNKLRAMFLEVADISLLA